MANARKLCLVPKATYIPLTRIGGFALGDAKNVRHLMQKIPTCWYICIFALGDANVQSFELGDAKVPNANGFASQWNIGLTTWSDHINTGYANQKQISNHAHLTFKGDYK